MLKLWMRIVAMALTVVSSNAAINLKECADLLTRHPGSAAMQSWIEKTLNYIPPLRSAYYDSKFQGIHFVDNRDQAFSLSEVKRLDREALAKLGLKADPGALMFAQDEQRVVDALKVVTEKLGNGVVGQVLSDSTAQEQLDFFRQTIYWSDVNRVATQDNDHVVDFFQSSFSMVAHGEAGLAASLERSIDHAWERRTFNLRPLNRTRIVELANAKVSQIRAEIFAETLDALTRNELKFESDHGLETIALDHDKGIPDVRTYEFARRAEKNRIYLRFLEPRDRDPLLRLIRAKTVAYNRAWDTEQARKLTEITYTELESTGGFKNRPIRDFVESGRFSQGINILNAYDPSANFWWTDAAHVSKYRSNSSGAPALTEITAETSRSPLKELYGPNAKRYIFWPKSKGSSFPDLSRFRIVANTVGNVTKSLEVLVNAAEGEPPFGFSLVSVEGELIPAQRFIGYDIVDACVQCHAKEAGSNEMAFKPHFLNTAEDLYQVGYRLDPELARLLLNNGHF